jgi:two-component system, cell cycle sensor histidine kinase PleC
MADQNKDLAHSAQRAVILSVVLVGVLASAAAVYEYFHLAATGRLNIYSQLVIMAIALCLPCAVLLVFISRERFLRPVTWAVFFLGSLHLLTFVSISLLVDSDVSLAVQHGLWIIAVQVCLFATLDRRTALSLSALLFAALLAIVVLYLYVGGHDPLTHVHEGPLIQLLIATAAILVLLGGLSSFRELALVETARAEASEENATLLRASVEEAKAERQTAVRALIKAEKAAQARDSFLASMSHELRTPLNAIIGFSQILEMGDDVIAGQPDKKQEYISDIRHSGEHMLTLINQILEYSRLESEGSELNYADHDVVGLAETAMRKVEMLEGAKHVRLQRQWDTQLDYTIETDERALSQILINLLSNAVKFTPEGGLVSLKIEPDAGGGLDIEVRDDGIGMAQDKIAHVSDPFFQIGDQRSTGTEGTGLGLSIVRSLVRELGGKFEIQSRIGEGTLCRVRLPAKIGPATPRDEAADETPLAAISA